MHEARTKIHETRRYGKLRGKGHARGIPGRGRATRKMQSATLQVVLAIPTDQGMTIAQVQVRGTKPPTSALLSVRGRGDRWRVQGIGYGQALAWAEGVRTLALKPEGHDRPLRRDDLLEVAESVPSGAEAVDDLSRALV